MHRAPRPSARATSSTCDSQNAANTSSVLSTMDSAPAEADVLASPASRSADAAAATKDSDSAGHAPRPRRVALRAPRREGSARGRATRVARRLGPALGGAAAATGFVSVIPSRAVVRAASGASACDRIEKLATGRQEARSHHR